MRRYLLFFSALVLLVLASLPARRTLAAGSSHYTFTKIAETGSTFGSLGEFSMNDAGVVAFTGTLLSPPDPGIFTSNGGSPTAIVTESLGFQFLRAPAINKQGQVAFIGLQPLAQRRGIYLSSSPGSAALRVAEEFEGSGRQILSPGATDPTSGLPIFELRLELDLNDGGDVAFSGYSGQLLTQFPFFVPGVKATWVASAGGAIRTVSSMPQERSGGFGEATLNNTGQVAYSYFFGAPRAIRLEGLELANDAGPLDEFGTSGINASGTVVFQARDDTGGGGVYRKQVSDAAPQLLVEHGAAVQSPGYGSVAINDSGQVAYDAYLTVGGSGIFVGPDLEADKVIASGDPLFGSTVTYALLAKRHSLNSHGQIAFVAFLADGRTVIARADKDELRPVIIVPGIGGSALDDNPNGNPEDESLSNLLSEEWPSDVLGFGIGTPEHLQFDASGNPVPGVSASLRATGLLNAPGRDLWDLVNFFHSNGYTRGQNLFIYAYDFRRPVEQNMLGLRQLITQVAQTHPKVDLVCHSMGGLVAKSALREAATADRVGRLVMLGTPHLGAAAGFQALRYGYDMGTPTINAFKMKRAIHNLPGVYDLLPSEAYLQGQRYFSDFADLDGNGQSGPINDPAAMFDFLAGAVEKINPLSLLNDPPPVQRQNATLLDRTRVFHRALDSWTKPAGIKAYMIMGINGRTPTFYREYRQANGGYEATVRHTAAGDSTVPLISGQAVLDQVDQFYWVDVARLGVDHGTYGSAPKVQSLVLSLLRDDTAPRADAPDIYTNAAAAAAALTPSFNWITLSPVTLDYVDGDGHHVGRLPAGDPAGEVEKVVPGSNFQAIGAPDGTDNLAVPSGTRGKLLVTPKQATGFFTLQQETVSPDGTVQQTTTYQNVPLAGVRQFVLTTGGGSAGGLLADLDGDGRGDRSIPGVVTSGEAPAVTFASLEADFRRAQAEGALSSPAYGRTLLVLLTTARQVAERRNTPAARRLLEEVARQLQRARPGGIEPGWAQGLLAQTQLLLRTL